MTTRPKLPLQLSEGHTSPVVAVVVPSELTTAGTSGCETAPMIVEDPPQPPTILRPGAWALGPEDRPQPAGRVYALVLESQLPEFRLHEPGIRADEDPEHVHAQRVAVRRARSLLTSGKRVFPGALRRGLAASMTSLSVATSGVRDLDVLLAAIGQRTESISPELRDGSQHLLAAFRLRRSTRFDELESLMEGPRYAATLRNWQRLGSVYRVGGDEPGPDALLPAGVVVDAALMAALHRVRDGGRRAHATDELTDWHELRKRLKRLRYLVAAFAPMYPDGSMDPVVRRVRKLQNVLGRLQDHATEIALIESVGAAMGGRGALAAGALSDQLHRATVQDLEHCLGAWARFDHRSVRRTLRANIAAYD